MMIEELNKYYISFYNHIAQTGHPRFDDSILVFSPSGTAEAAAKPTKSAPTKPGQVQPLELSPK
jgi:hypothetical protein